MRRLLLAALLFLVVPTAAHAQEAPALLADPDSVEQRPSEPAPTLAALCQRIRAEENLDPSGGPDPTRCRILERRRLGRIEAAALFLRRGHINSHDSIGLAMRDASGWRLMGETASATSGQGMDGEMALRSLRIRDGARPRVLLVATRRQGWTRGWCAGDGGEQACAERPERGSSQILCDRGHQGWRCSMRAENATWP